MVNGITAFCPTAKDSQVIVSRGLSDGCGRNTVMYPAIVWAVIGIVLIIIELLSVTFVLVFFGVGALIVAATTWVGITPGLSGQLAVFSVSSFAILFAFRKMMKRVFFGSHDVKPDYAGQNVKGCGHTFWHQAASRLARWRW